MHLLALTAGEATLVLADGGEAALPAPHLLWMPSGSVERLHMPAGASAALLGIDAAVFHRYLTSATEMPGEHLIGAREMLALGVDRDCVETVRRSVAAIAHELTEPARPGAASIVSCELSLCVLRVWRLLGQSSEAAGAGNATEILRRFQRLVEERYREHLPVSAYARLLGITPDRLHAVCRRELELSPRDLVQRRVVREASTRLEGGGATVKQIAFALGFKDTAYFNRFFRRHLGQPPGRWRRSTAGKTLGEHPPRPSSTFADWP